MAQPATIAIQSLYQPDVSRRKKRYYYGIQLADPGTPTYPAGGIVVDLTTITNPKGFPRAKWARATLPDNSEIEQLTTPGGYQLQLQQAAANPTLKNFVLRIWTTMGGELGTGSNIPALLFGALLASAPMLEFELRSQNFY